MSKLIKHEFRATSRFMLPVLLISVVSGLFMAIPNNSSMPSWLMGLVAMVFGLSLFAIFALCIIIVVGRFYQNTMTDTGYLTMTLPVNMHQFVFSELIVSILWILIAVVVLGFLGFICLSILGQLHFLSFIEIRDGMGILQDTMNQHNINIGLVILICFEALVFAVLAFIIYCLRFYLAMAIGQIFANHKVLLSVICYIILGSIIAAFFIAGAKFLGNTGSFELLNEPSSIAGFLAAVDGIMLVGAALLYIPTIYILSDNLNLA